MTFFAHRESLKIIVVLVTFLLVSGVALLASEPPAVPELLPDWNQIADIVASEHQLKTIGQKLGIKPRAVRNIIYRVSEIKRAQINVLVASNAEDADKIMASLKKIKTEKALLRDGLVIYEFVGANNVFSQIVEARKLLEKKLAKKMDEEFPPGVNVKKE
ncbi:MAG: hypothetical protein ACQETH_10675 [Candidatus Rifleibacteriota bacterium]